MTRFSEAWYEQRTKAIAAEERAKIDRETNCEFVDLGIGTMRLPKPPTFKPLGPLVKPPKDSE